MTMIMNTQGHD